MKEVICPHCSGTVLVPAELAKAHCIHCGQALDLEYHVTAEALPAPPHAIQSSGQDAAPGATQNYANWDEFRSNSPSVQRQLFELATRPLPDLRGAVCQDLPDTVPAPTDDLGEPLASLSVAGESHWLGPGVGGVLFAAALVIAVSCLVMPLLGQAFGPRRGGNGVPILSPGFVIPGIASVAAVAIGIWIIFLRVPRLSFTLWLFENGLLLKQGRQLLASTFEDVNGFWVDTETGCPYYEIKLGDIRVEIPAAQEPSMMPLMEYVEIKISAEKFLPLLRRVFENERAVFGAVILDRDGMKTSRSFLPWREIERVVTDTKTIFVHQYHRQDWHPIALRKVSFPHLFVAIAHVMIDEDKNLSSC
jgi:hypothetical protein